MKISKDIADQIVSELAVKFDVGRARGKKDTEIIGELGSVNSVAEMYARKFGYVKNNATYNPENISSIDSYNKGANENINYGNKYDTYKKSAYNKSNKNYTYNKETYNQSNKSNNREDNKPISNPLESIGKVTEKWINNNNNEKKVDPQSESKSKKTGKIILAIIVFLIFKANIWNMPPIKDALQSGFGNLIQISSDNNVISDIKTSEKVHKVIINGKNVDILITYGNSKNSCIVYGREIEDESFDLTSEIDTKIENGVMTVDVKKEMTEYVSRIEILSTEPQELEAEIESLNGGISIDNSIKNLKINSKESDINISGKNTYDMQINSDAENSLINIIFDSADAQVETKTQGDVNITLGEDIYTDETGNEIKDVSTYEGPYNFYGQRAKYGNGTHKINIKSNFGTINFEVINTEN